MLPECWPAEQKICSGLCSSQSAAMMLYNTLCHLRGSRGARAHKQRITTHAYNTLHNPLSKAYMLVLLTDFKEAAPHS